MFLPVRVFLPLTMLSLQAGNELPPQRALETKADGAVRIARAMLEDLTNAQKAVIAKFKALPDSDDIRMNWGKNIYGWSVSDKCLSTRQEEFQTALAAYLKDFKDTALIDELRLFSKKIAKNSQENIFYSESRLAKAKQELRDGKMADKDGKVVNLTDADKKTREGLLQILPLEIEYQTAAKRIVNAHGAGLAKLLD